MALLPAPSLLACVGAALGVAALVAASAPSFAAAKSYATGQHPLSVAIGDLNGDGKPDLATANGFGNNTVSVLLNRGDGSFRARRAYGTGHDPDSVAIGDLNGDGKNDLVTANHLEGGTVSVLLNKGDGSFQFRRDYATGSGPVSVAIGDLNGDGKPDLAAATSNANTRVSVLLNKGDGSFDAKARLRRRTPVESVAIGDLNGDGSPDLATANAEGNTASRAPQQGRRQLRGHARRPGDIPRSLLGRDRRLERRPQAGLVTANSAKEVGPTLSVFLNRGAGTFRRKNRLSDRNGRLGGGRSVAIGDLNGDGNRTW